MENYADRAANPSRNEGNSLVGGIKHSPDYVIVQLIGEILDQNEGSRDGAVLYQPRSKSKGKIKAANRPTSLSKKAMKLPRTPETVELLLKYTCIKEYKTKCEFVGVDFKPMASGFRDFFGRHSSRDNHTHVKEGYLMTLLQARVTLLGGLPSFHVNRPYYRFKST